MEIPASGDQIMELTGDKLKELTNAIEDEEDDDEVKLNTTDLNHWLLLNKLCLEKNVLPLHFAYLDMKCIFLKDGTIMHYYVQLKVSSTYACRPKFISF